MVWFILAGIAGLAALATIWPLLRAAAPPPAAPGDAAFYKAQIDEIERDVARGLLPRSEAEAARAEAARRLLARPSAAPKSSGAASRGPRMAAAVLSLVLLAGALPLYLYLGQPEAADQPLAGRAAEPDPAREIAAAIAGVEAHLAEKPDDGQGWAVLAPVYMRFGRFGDAAHAYSEALRLLGENADRRAALGEALTAAADGAVTSEARAAFEKALADQPGNPQARYYLALAFEQDGKSAEAVAAFQALEKDSAPDAPWRAMVEARIAALTSGKAPDSIPDDQRPMIEGMVGRLAERLADKGGAPEEWVRLIRAYTVLHQADKAKAALADARKALAPNAQAIAQLDALARDLRLGDTP